MASLRILFLAANPQVTSRLALDEESRAIKESLQDRDSAVRIEIVEEWAVRADDIPKALLRHQPHIVHFSGHGLACGDLVFAGSRPAELSQLTAETLLGIFKTLKAGVLCVVLNACYSEIIARQLSSVVPCVVGMSREVTDEAAQAFATGFYQGLAFGKTFFDAWELGRLAIELKENQERPHESQREVPRPIFRPDVDPDKLSLLTLGPAGSQPSAQDEQAARNELAELLKRRFRQSERESLLFRLGLHPEDVKLRPEDRDEFARAMVLHLENLGRLADLWDAVYQAREVFLRGRRNPFR